MKKIKKYHLYKNKTKKREVELNTINEKGYIIANEDCKTNIKNIFVAGDTRTKELRQLVTATSDGAIAATGAIKYINETNK